MKISRFLAIYRQEVRKLRRLIAVAFACGCAYYARVHNNSLSKSLFYSILLACCVYIIMHCLDRAIGILSPIIIDLSKIKGVSIRKEDYSLCIENEDFSIKAPEGYLGGPINSFELREKVTGENGDEMITIVYTGMATENCLIFDGKTKYQINAGLARQLLIILGCHAETKKACRGLSFLA